MKDSSYSVYLQDCVQGMPDKVEPESVDLVVTSIPFGALFQYSAKTEDIGNNADGVDMRGSMFGLNMRFFIEQLFRVMKPGTNACIHIQQLLAYKVQHGYMGRRDFRAAVIDLFVAGGFEWKGEIVIPKNPQALAQRHKLHSLLFVTGMRNARDLAPAVNDYVAIFQKPGEAEPVPCLFDSDKNPNGWVTKDEWIRDAHGVWTDIRETDVLDGYRAVRDEDDEKHVCPLQLEVIRRLVRLYSNPGELVLDPFSGIGSTGYVALDLDRSYLGFELKESYYFQSLKNLAKLVQSKKHQVVDLFSESGDSAAS